MDLVEILRRIGESGSSNGDNLSNLIGGISILAAATLTYWNYRKSQEVLSLNSELQDFSGYSFREDPELLERDYLLP